MMKSLTGAALAACALSFPFTASAHAQDERTVFAGAKISTLGVGGEAGIRFNDRFGVRASGTVFQYEFNETLDGIDSDIELELGAVGGQIDIHPFANAFFVSAGAYANLNEVTTTATPSEPVEIGGMIYTPEEIGSITGVGSFEDIAPYAGLGAAWRLGANWEFVTEAGAYFQGEPEITYEATGLLADNPQFDADLRAEAEKAQEDLAQLDVYPMVSLTIRRRF